MRLMSFFLTQRQIRDGSKTVTRRLGWSFLKPGDRLMACVKCQGLGKGGKIQKIRKILVITVRKEPLNWMLPGKLWHPLNYGQLEVSREGFPGMNPAAFVDMFCLHMKCRPSSKVTRIEFKYV